MLRRPMLYAACGVAGAAAVSYYIGICASLAAVALLLAAACSGRAGRTEKRRHAAWILFFSCLLGTISYWHTDRVLTAEAAQLEGSSLRGEITDCAARKNQSGEPYLQLTVRSEQGSVVARYYDPVGEDTLEGRMAEITGTMKEPAGRRNPACFDYALYLRSLGITRTVTCDSIRVDPVRPFSAAPAAFARNKICQIRERFISRLAEGTDESTAAVMRAILFGDKGGLSEDTLETFQKNGTAHILAVSGLHIGIIYGFILKLWRWRRGWGFFGFNLIFFLFYAAAAGFSPSVTRAVVMVLLHIAAGIRGWRYDLSNGAFAVGIWVLLRNPFMLFNTGFQMSFLAVLTLVLVLPYLKRFYSGVLLASMAVQIGLGPFILNAFNYLPLLAVFINVPVAALASLIVPAGLVAMALGSAPGAAVVFEVVKLLCGVLCRLNEAALAGGVTCMQLPSPPLWTLAAYYLCLLLFATEEGRLAVIRAPRRGRYVLRMLLVVMLVSWGFQAFASDGFDKCAITFVDVGQGDCMHLRIDDSGRVFGRKDAYHVLIDGGGRDGFDVGKKILRPYLLKNGVGTVDLAIVTHLHNDHYDGIRSLCQMGMVKKLCVYEGYKVEEKQILEECCLDRGDLIYAAAGDVLTVGDASFTMLAPPALSDSGYARLAEEEEDENRKSLLIRAEYHGISAMMTGDIGEDGERDAMDQPTADLRCDILKVGHHGSKTSTCDDFLDAVRPAAAVIQVGENNMYGHPSPETLTRLERRGVPVYRNDLQGAVGVEVGGGEIKEIKTMVPVQPMVDSRNP